MMLVLIILYLFGGITKDILNRIEKENNNSKKYKKSIDKESKKSYNKNRSNKEYFMQVSYNGYYLSLPS